MLKEYLRAIDKDFSEKCGPHFLRLSSDFVPEPHSRDHGEMVSIGDQDRACLQGMGSDPNIIDGNWVSGLFEGRGEEPEDIRRFRTRLEDGDGWFEKGLLQNLPIFSLGAGIRGTPYVMH